MDHIKFVKDQCLLLLEFLKIITKEVNRFLLLNQAHNQEDSHIDDTVNTIMHGKKSCRHYSIANKKSYSVIEVAKLFNSKIKLLPKRLGERYASALINKNLSNKMYKHFGKISLKDYINNFIFKNN